MQSDDSSRTKLLRGGWLRTVHAALPTPFTIDGALAEEPLRALVDRLLEAGISVFLPAAGNGEFHSLSDDEITQSVRITREACGDSAVVVGPIGFDLRRSLALARDAIVAGADALLYMPPVHPYLSDDGFAPFMRELGAGTAVPLLLYRKGECPSDTLLARLMRERVIAGVKYAGSDPEAVARVVAKVGQGVLCGTGERFAPYFGLAGAGGFSSGAANVAPRLSLRLLAEMHAGDFPAAMRTLDLIRPFEELRARDNDAYNVPALKAALRISGIDFGEPRPPQRSLSPSEHDEVSAVVQALQAAEACAGQDTYARRRHGH